MASNDNNKRGESKRNKGAAVSTSTVSSANTSRPTPSTAGAAAAEPDPAPPQPSSSTSFAADATAATMGYDPTEYQAPHPEGVALSCTGLVQLRSALVALRDTSSFVVRESEIALRNRISLEWRRGQRA